MGDVVDRAALVSKPWIWCTRSRKWIEIAAMNTRFTDTATWVNNKLGEARTRDHVTCKQDRIYGRQSGVTVTGVHQDLR